MIKIFVDEYKANKCYYELQYETIQFPVGELHVIIKDLPKKSLIDIDFEFKNSDSIIKLLLIANAIKEAGCEINKLTIPYMPFSRQDRINIIGECFSLKVFANLINSIGAKEVITYDAHSDVITALINNCTNIPQHDIFMDLIKNLGIVYLISSDGGALKKIYKLSQKCPNVIDVIECSRIRNVSNGEIKETRINIFRNFDHIVPCVIVDDICDGGRTFIEIAKELKRLSIKKVILCITHGFFTKGIEVFDGLIDEIYTMNRRIK
jgi:ribose-phosphate pyrophosphokinase